MASVEASQGAGQRNHSTDDLIQDSYNRISAQAEKIVSNQRASDETSKEAKKKGIEAQIVDDTKYLIRLILGVTWCSKHCHPRYKKICPAPLSHDQKEVVRRLRSKMRRYLEDPETQEGISYSDASGMRAEVKAIGKFLGIDLIDKTKHEEKRPSRKKAAAKKASKPKNPLHRPFPLYDTETNPALAFLRKHFYGIQMARETSASLAGQKSSDSIKRERQLKRQDLKKRLDNRIEMKSMDGAESLLRQEEMAALPTVASLLR